MITNWELSIVRKEEECVQSILHPDMPCPICGEVAKPNTRQFHPGLKIEIDGTFDSDNPNIKPGSAMAPPVKCLVDEVTITAMTVAEATKNLPAIFRYSFSAVTWVGFNDSN